MIEIISFPSLADRVRRLRYARPGHAIAADGTDYGGEINRNDTDDECRRDHLDSPERPYATKLERTPTKEPPEWH